MNRSVGESVYAISFDSGPRWPVERHVLLRIEYVIHQVSLSHAGQPEEEVARVIADRLRGLGVHPVAQQVRQYAQAIAQLPPSPQPPRAA